MRRSQKPEYVTRPRDDARNWWLLTPHALVLLCIAQDPETRVREIADTVGISERGAHQILSELVDGGYVRRARIGRRNRYAIEEKTALKHEIVRHRRVASLIALLGPEPPRVASKNRRRAPGDAPLKTKRRAA